MKSPKQKLALTTLIGLLSVHSFAQETYSTTTNEVQLEFYFYCLGLILTGVGLALIGLKSFKLSFSISNIIIGTLTLAIFNILSVTSFAGILILSVLIFIFLVPLTYFISYIYISGIIAMPFYALFKNTEIYTYCVYAAMSVGVVVTYLLRKHIRAILIGISSGSAIALGLSGIISANLFYNGHWADALTLPLVLWILFVISGVAFQIMYIMKKGAKPKDNTSAEVIQDKDQLAAFKSFLTKYKYHITTSLIIFISICVLMSYKKTETRNKEYVERYLIELEQTIDEFKKISEEIGQQNTSKKSDAMFDSAIKLDGLKNKVDSIKSTLSEEELIKFTTAYLKILSKISASTPQQPLTAEASITKESVEETVQVENQAMHSIDEASDYIGTYKTMFGDKELIIWIDEVSNGVVKARNVYKDIETEMNGTVKGEYLNTTIPSYIFELKEPTGKNNGVFTITFSRSQGTGTWKSYSNKLNRNFELEFIND